MNKILAAVKWPFIILLIISCIGALNYSGFCFKTMGYLSNYEKIKIAIDYLIDDEKNRYLERNKTLNGFDFYQDADSFLESNPDCCEVGKSFITYYRIISPYLYSGICGRRSDDVYILYSYYKPDNSHNIEINPSTISKALIAISNCGSSWDVFKSVR